MIQAYYKYRPASFGALVLLVGADGKDRRAQGYMADMLYLVASTRYKDLPSFADYMQRKPRQRMTAEKANAIVDDMIRKYGGGKK